MARNSNDRVYDEMLCFLSEPIFQIPVRSFMDENCLIFDPDTERSKEHREIFAEYKKLVDALLDAFCEDAKITTDEAMKGISRLNKIPDIHDLFYGLFEQVLAATDFDIFYAAMAKRNIMIQEQVLAMILASSGALPSSLVRDSHSNQGSKSPPTVSATAAEDKQELQLLQLVMKKSSAINSGKPGDADKEFSQKTVQISQKEAEHLAKERHQLEQQMQHLVLDSKQDVHPVDVVKTGGSGGKTNITDKPSAEASVTSQQAASNWLKSAQSESCGISSTTHSTMAANLSQLSADEIRERQEFLRKQRDKLLAMKKEARASQLEEAERSHGAQRPVSARTARTALSTAATSQSSATSTDSDKKMAMRRAIAEKLRQEVIGKQ